MDYKTISYEKDEDGVVLITLNRPQKLNSMSIVMFWEILKALKEIEADEEAKAVVLTGAGRAFSSGADLWAAEPLELSKEEQAEFDAMGAEFRAKLGGINDMGGFFSVFWALENKIFDFEKPMIAAINGLAFGVGLCLAQCCDLVYASENATMSYLFIRNAIGTTDMGTTYLIPRSLGIYKAKELMMLGDTISAREAERLGLVNGVFPPDELMPEVRKVARRFAKGPTMALKQMKRVINSQHKDGLSRAFELEIKAAVASTSSLECMEALMRRGQKQEPFPEFTGG